MSRPVWILTERALRRFAVDRGCPPWQVSRTSRLERPDPIRPLATGFTPQHERGRRRVPRHGIKRAWVALLMGRMRLVADRACAGPRNRKEVSPMVRREQIRTRRNSGAVGPGFRRDAKLRDRSCTHKTRQQPGDLRFDANAHSTTSSARASSVGGMVRLRVFAVFRLTISSNLVGCCTGSSAGFAPFRIFPT